MLKPQKINFFEANGQENVEIKESYLQRKRKRKRERERDDWILRGQNTLSAQKRCIVRKT